MSISGVAKTDRDTVLTLKDGTGTPLDVIITYEPGDFKIDGVTPNQAEILEFYDRGILYSLRLGNQIQPQYSLTFDFTDLSDATNENVWDMIRGTGAFAARISTYGAGATAEVTTFLWLMTTEGTNHGDPSDHTLTMDDSSVTSFGLAEGRPGKYNLAGKIYGTITAT
jgi:hypothetical protein